MFKLEDSLTTNSTETVNMGRPVRECRSRVPEWKQKLEARKSKRSLERTDSTASNDDSLKKVKTEPPTLTKEKITKPRTQSKEKITGPPTLTKETTTEPRTLTKEKITKPPTLKKENINKMLKDKQEGGKKPFHSMLTRSFKSDVDVEQMKCDETDSDVSTARPEPASPTSSTLSEVPSLSLIQQYLDLDGENAADGASNDLQDDHEQDSAPLPPTTFNYGQTSVQTAAQDYSQKKADTQQQVAQKEVDAIAELVELQPPQENGNFGGGDGRGPVPDDSPILQDRKNFDARATYDKLVHHSNELMRLTNSFAVLGHRNIVDYEPLFDLRLQLNSLATVTYYFNREKTGEMETNAENNGAELD